MRSTPKRRQAGRWGPTVVGKAARRSRSVLKFTSASESAFPHRAAMAKKIRNTECPQKSRPERWAWPSGARLPAPGGLDLVGFAREPCGRRGGNATGSTQYFSFLVVLHFFSRMELTDTRKPRLLLRFVGEFLLRLADRQFGQSGKTGTSGRIYYRSKKSLRIRIGMRRFFRLRVLFRSP